MTTLRNAANPSEALYLRATKADDGSPTGEAHVVLTGGYAAAAVPNAVASGTANVEPAVAAATGLRLMGFSVTEDAVTPAAAEVRIIHGSTVAGGVEIATITLTGDESTSEVYGNWGIDCPNGISVERVSGATRITLLTKVVT